MTQAGGQLVDEDAERAVLATLLSRSSSLDDLDGLVPDHFAMPAHRAIYETTVKLIQRHGDADLVSLKGALRDNAAVITLGGPGYLARMMSQVVLNGSVRQHADTVRALAIRRRLVEVGQEIAVSASTPDPDKSAAQLVDDAEARIFALAEGHSPNAGLHTFDDALGAAVESAERVFKANGRLVGVSTGLRDLDRQTGGLHPGDFAVKAARTGMGKTALALAIAKGAAMAGHTVLFWTGEMSAEQLGARMLSDFSGISLERLRIGPLSREDIDTLEEARQRRAALPIVIDDRGGITVAQIRSRAMRIRRKQGLGLIIADYIQLLSGGARVENRTQEVSKISRDLKVMAKQLSVPVLGLSQLSRAIESRDDKRPKLSDLRESGSIEQDADIVMFVHRDEYYLNQEEPRAIDFTDKAKHVAALADWEEKMSKCRGVAEVLIRKNRHGAERTVRLAFEGACTRFGDLEERYGG